MVTLEQAGENAFHSADGAAVDHDYPFPF